MTKGSREEDEQHNRTESLPRPVCNPIGLHLLLSVSQAKAKTQVPSPHGGSALTVESDINPRLSCSVAPFASASSSPLPLSSSLQKPVWDGKWAGMKDRPRPASPESKLSSSASLERARVRRLASVSPPRQVMMSRHGSTGYMPEEEGGNDYVDLYSRAQAHQKRKEPPTQLSCCDLSNFPFPSSAYEGITSESAPAGMGILCGSLAKFIKTHHERNGSSADWKDAADTSRNASTADTVQHQYRHSSV